MNASKHFDPQLGVDFHMYVLPPTVLPTPHISLVIDFFDYLPIIGATVTIHGFKRTVAGTAGKVVHIPLGAWAPPLKAPMGPQTDDELFMGSSTVIVDGDPLTYRMLPTLSCNIAGMVSPFRPRKKSKPIPLSMSLPLTVNVALPHNVYVGGTPTVSMMALGMKAGLALFGRLRRSSRFLDAMGKFKEFRRKLFKDMDSGFIKCKVLRAEPVDIRDRSVSLVHQDFSVAGRFPLVWQRHYRSSRSDEIGICGRGWRTLADTRLCYYPQADGWLLELPDGPLCFLDTPTEQGRSHGVSGLFGGLFWYEQQLHRTDWFIEFDGVIYRFSEPRQPIKTERQLPLSAFGDRNGNHWQFIYQQDQLITLVEAHRDGVTGREVQLSYLGQRITALHLTDSYSPDEAPYELTVYDYDEHQQLHQQLDRQGQARRFIYHDRYYLSGHYDRLGQGFYYQYDENHCVTRAWGDGGLYDYQFNWLKDYLELEVINSLGHKSIIRMSPDGLPQCEIDPQGGATFFAYDDWGRTVQVTESNGKQVTQWQYDEQGNLTEEWFNDECVLRVEYEEMLPVSLTDKTGTQWRYTYDRYGNLVRTTDPLNLSRDYRYDEFGQLIQVMHPNKTQEQFGYNRLGFLTQRQDTTRQTTVYELDSRGNLLSETNPLGHTTRYHYDTKDRLIQVNRHQQPAVYLAYDAEDQLLTYRDEAGQETQLTYNGTGEVTGCRTPDGNWIRYTYDTEDQLIAVENQRQQRWQLKRDEIGQIIEEVDYWGQSRRYQYDLYHHLVATEDALGNKIEYKYNKKGQLLEKLHNGETLTRYAYTPSGQLSLCHNPWRKLEWTYDVGGRLIEESQDGFLIQHHYTPLGQYFGRGSHTGNQVIYDYNELGQISHIQLNQQKRIALHYDALGRVIQENLTDSLRRELDYNPQHQLTAQRVLRDNQSLFETCYQYDVLGNLTQRKDNLWGIDQYQYDAIGQVTAHTDPLGKINAFLYDATGNRLQDVVAQRYPHQANNSANDENEHTSPQFRDSQLDDLRYTYDQAGQLVKRQQVDKPETLETFSWNAQQQLIGYQRQGNTTEYAYDGLGRRVYKKTAKSVRWFFWHGDALFAETNTSLDFNITPQGIDITQPRAMDLFDSEGPRRDQFKLMHNRIREYFYYPNSFVPLALIEGPAGEKQTYYYHNDINGAPDRLTDAKGHIVWSAHSHLWGEEYLTYSNCEVNNPLRFQGQYFDSESGLHYNRHRYYDPISGSFICQDPIGLLGGLNPYQYAPNPLGWVDPLGLTPCTPKGFKNSDEFNQFGREIRQALSKAGYSDTTPIIQGSAVTGKSYRTGKLFDQGRVSDFDIALAGSDVMSAANKAGIPTRGQGTRTRPLTEADLKKMGLFDLANDMSKKYGRDVNFMIYDSIPTATNRAPSITLPQ